MIGESRRIMRRSKRIISIITIIVALVLIVGCGAWYVLKNSSEEQINTVENNTNESVETETVATPEAENIEEQDKQKDETGMSPEELFQAFCDGKITAEARSYYDDTTWTMDNTSFQFEENTPEEELDPTIVVKKVEPVDLDNDGELEFILENAFYGDMCFDCKDGKVVCFSQGEGTAAMCSYTQYDGAYWIVHSDTTHAGRCTYELTKFNGDLEVVDSFRFGWEDWEDTGVKTYYQDDNEITEADYEALYDKVF